MKKLKSLLFFLLCILCLKLHAQELPPIHNFSPIDYQAENQNWAITQTKDKLIYIANNKGLLEYNGATWTLYSSPNETIMRSVKAIDSLIYTGSYMEFGFWKKNELETLEYTSLSKNLSLELIEDEEFWNIVEIERFVIFQSQKRIYIYNSVNKAINIINSNEKITRIFKVGNSIYFQRINEGVFKIEDEKDILYLDDEIVKTNEIVDIFPREKGLLIVTQNDGFYGYENGVLEKLEEFQLDDAAVLGIYDAIQLENNDLIIGTIGKGLIYMTSQGEVLYQIDQNTGLLNNTVLSLFEDVDSTIWAGLDNGISFVNVNRPFRIFTDKRGNLGSVYAAAIHNGRLYVGTNQGLFFKSVDSNTPFRFIQGTAGQVWNLKVIDGTLFCAHHSGTYVVEQNRITKIAGVAGTWDIKKSYSNANLLIQGNYDGLYILEKSNEKWKFRNKIEGFNNSSRHFENIGNLIFVNHEYKGVFKIEVDNAFKAVNSIEEDTLLKGSNSGISKYQGAILYAYRKGIFKYHDKHKTFVKDSVLSKVYTEESYVSGKMLPDESKDELWIFTRDNLTRISPSEFSSSSELSTVPLTQNERNDVVEYENVLHVGGNNYLIGTSSGYIIVDIGKDFAQDFSVHIGSIINGVNKDYSASKNRIEKSEKGKFKNHENTFEITFFSPQYNRFLKPRYQFQLLGIYDKWSNWTAQPRVLFENLPSGEYTFNVRSKVGNKISSNIASYNFTIAKPWYYSNLMIALYALSVVLFSIFMHNVYKSYYQRERIKLIEKNRRELDLAKAMNDKEIMRIKSERLEKEFKSKSKELAASTMSIVKKNELLAQIKEKLLRLNDNNAVTPMIQIIDRNLNHNDNWEFFKEAFDNADSEFFKTLKEAHPNLTPNDLKLCAYLRLNLSSKEIAPMFNISARSVEIKRYRLRKKMSLSSNENLTNYILSL